MLALLRKNTLASHAKLGDCWQIYTPPSSLSIVLAEQWYCSFECHLAVFVLGGNLTFVRLNNSLCNGKSQAVATLALVARGVQSVKSVKNVSYLLGCDLVAVVCDSQNGVFVVHFEFEADVALADSVLVGIVQQDCE